MAIKKAVPIKYLIVGDGSSTSYTFDLLSDPYVLSDEGSDNVVNWFTENKKFANPVDVIPNASGMSSASISGTVVTVTLAAAVGSGGTAEQGLIVVFA